MKNLIYIVLLIIVGSIIFNLYSINYRISLLAEMNKPFILGLCAGICGLLLSVIFLYFRKLKERMPDKTSHDS